MLHIVHLIERRFGAGAPRIIGLLLVASALLLAVGSVLLQLR